MKFRGADPVANARLALDKNMATGSGAFLLIGKDAHQEEIEGSRIARRHKSTSGNNSAGCRISARVAVMRAQGTNRPGVALGFDDAAAVVTKADFKKGKTACDRICLI